MDADAAMKVIERLKGCIREQRRLLNDQKQREKARSTDYQRMCDRYGALRDHADRCCTCGEKRHR